jgi:hypothetical protein
VVRASTAARVDSSPSGRTVTTLTIRLAVCVLAMLAA